MYWICIAFKSCSKMTQSCNKITHFIITAACHLYNKIFRQIYIFCYKPLFYVWIPVIEAYINYLMQHMQNCS